MLTGLSRFVGAIIILALTCVGLNTVVQNVLGWKDDSDRVRRLTNRNLRRI